MQSLEVLIFTYFLINYSNNRFIGVFDMAIKHKMEFGQAYCKDLLKRNPKEIYFVFFEFYCIFYEFWNLKGISGKDF
jgi:hypothetical protein